MGKRWGVSVSSHPAPPAPLACVFGFFPRRRGDSTGGSAAGLSPVGAEFPWRGFAAQLQLGWVR